MLKKLWKLLFETPISEKPVGERFSNRTLHGRFANKIDALSEPCELADEVIEQGNLNHKHELVTVKWDDVYGSNVTDFDSQDHNSVISPISGNKLAFPMATHKTLKQCDCGRKVISKIRALV